MHIERDQIKTVLILLAMSVAFVLLVYVPNRIKAASLDTRIATARQQLGLELAETRGLVRLAGEVEQLQRTTSAAQRYVPQRDELADMLRQISRELQTQQVSGQQMQTEPIRHGPDYNVIPIHLQFQGSFPSAFGFLRQIESMHRLIRIERVQIESDIKAPNRLLHVEIALSTFSSTPEPPQP